MRLLLSPCVYSPRLEWIAVSEQCLRPSWCPFSVIQRVRLVDPAAALRVQQTDMSPEASSAVMMTSRTSLPREPVAKTPTDTGTRMSAA